MPRQIFAAEVSHENAPARVRERLSASHDSVKKIVSKLRPAMDEVFVLLTDTRFVIYGAGESINPLINYFLEDAEVFRYVQFYKNTQASVNHLFAMASGLCSHIKGEHEILAQIKTSHDISMKCGGIGLWLDNVLHQAIHVGKKIRTQTGIDKFGSSVVDAGLSVIYEKLENVFDKKFLVVGTSKIARLCLQYLQREGIHRITVASHDIKLAQDLAKRYNATAVSILNMQQYVKTADVIIGGAHHDVYLFPKAANGAVQVEANLLPEHKRVILDFGMPRNFDEKLKYQPGISLYNLDDLKAISPSPLDMFGGVEAAWRMAAAETQNFLVVLHHFDQVPALETYWNNSVPTVQEKKRWSLFKKREVTLPPSLSLQRSMAMLKNTQAENGLALVRRISPFTEISIQFSDN
jgi:glutamyl-tRNA reductase